MAQPTFQNPKSIQPPSSQPNQPQTTSTDDLTIFPAPSDAGSQFSGQQPPISDEKLLDPTDNHSISDVLKPFPACWSYFRYWSLSQVCVFCIYCLFSTYLYIFIWNTKQPMLYFSYLFEYMCFVYIIYIYNVLLFLYTYVFNMCFVYMCILSSMLYFSNVISIYIYMLFQQYIWDV